MAFLPRVGAVPLLWTVVLLLFCRTSTKIAALSQQTFVISHAAGRMGKLLAGQVREGSSLYGDGATTVRVRALVRSDAEALSVACDLAGMVTKGGTMTAKECDWLETVVVPNVSDEENILKLEAAFEGATGAVLCDASHNELVVLDDGRWSLRIPDQENNEDLSERLSAEIEAAGKSKTLEHLVLRSSMGLHLYRGKENTEEEAEAVRVMGGAEALSGPQRAEQALAADPSLDYTVLRLGALTDDAGMMPLDFGTDDSILLGRTQGQSTRRPPMISRADAARVAAFVLRERQAFAHKKMVVDCAWVSSMNQPSSVGSEEALTRAGRQDIVKIILESCDTSSIVQ